MFKSTEMEREKSKYMEFKANQGYQSFRNLMDFADDLDAIIQENESLKQEVFYLQEQVEFYKNAYDKLVATNNEGFAEIFSTLLSDDCKNFLTNVL